MKNNNNFVSYLKELKKNPQNNLKSYQYKNKALKHK